MISLTESIKASMEINEAFRIPSSIATEGIGEKFVFPGFVDGDDGREYFHTALNLVFAKLPTKAQVSKINKEMKAQSKSFHDKVEWDEIDYDNLSQMYEEFEEDYGGPFYITWIGGDMELVSESDLQNNMYMNDEDDDW